MQMKEKGIVMKISNLVQILNMVIPQLSIISAYFV